MATRITVVFSGRRFPAVRERKGASIGQFYQFDFHASGVGQRWDTDQPLAFWRSFSEIDLSYAAEVLYFVSRHGDPHGYLDRRIDGTNAEWPALRNALRDIAQAWEPPNSNGISFFTDDPKRLAGAQEALYELARPDKAGLPGVELIAQSTGRFDFRNPAFRPAGLVLRATNLRAFMIVSAGDMLQRGVAMKRCAYRRCRDWFELRRVNTSYCSGSCQAQDHKRRAMARETDHSHDDGEY